MAYPVHHRGRREKAVCAHRYLDAAGMCLDCNEAIVAREGTFDELCAYCYTDAQTDLDAPYCSVECRQAAEERG